MAKKMNEKRKKWIDAVKENDRVREEKRKQNKFSLGGKYGQPSNAERTGAQILTMRGVRRSKPHGLCCIDAYPHTPPSYFRECPDCPKTQKSA